MTAWAEQYAAEVDAHREPIPSCSCYDPASMEYDPATYPCAWCQTQDANREEPPA